MTDFNLASLKARQKARATGSMVIGHNENEHRSKVMCNQAENDLVATIVELERVIHNGQGKCNKCYLDEFVQYIGSTCRRCGDVVTKPGVS